MSNEKTFTPQPTSADAAELLEQEVAERREREQRAVLPSTAEDLLAATFGEAGRSGLSELQTRFVRVGDAWAAANLVEQRLTRYMREEDGSPTVLAERLVQAANGEELSEADWRALTELHHYMVGELGPLITDWQAAIVSNLHNPDDSLHTGAGMVEALSYGDVPNGPKVTDGEQRTVSVIGVLNHLAAQREDLSSLEVGETSYPQQLVVEDPLNDRLTSYWQARLEASQVYGARTPNQLIHWRTVHLQTALEDAAESLHNVDNDDEQLALYNAYIELANWLEPHAEAMEQPLDLHKEADQKAWQYYIGRMDFSHGRTEDIIEVFNAAERIKQANPRLFMRMIGVAPGRRQTEARRSDLFGSAFHVALHRTLELGKFPQYQELGARAQALTELDTQVEPMARLNADQLRALTDQFKAALVQPEIDATTRLLTSTMFLGMFARHHREVQLATMLNSVEHGERQETLDRLRTASPREFFALVKSLPAAMIEDPEVVEVAYERLAFKERSTAVAQLQSMHRDVNNEYQKNGHRMFENMLWRSAPDEALLSEEFFRYIDATLYDIELALEGAPVFKGQQKATPELVKPISRILADHPTISKQDWIQWYSDVMKAKQPTSLGLFSRWYPVAERISTLYEVWPTEVPIGSLGVVFGPSGADAIELVPSSTMDDMTSAAIAEGVDPSQPDTARSFTALAEGYGGLTNEAFLKRYRHNLIQLGGKAIMHLAQHGSPADFEEIVNELTYKPNKTWKTPPSPQSSSPYTVQFYDVALIKRTRPNADEPNWPSTMETRRYTQDSSIMLQDNPWQLELCDKLLASNNPDHQALGQEVLQRIEGASLLFLAKGDPDPQGEKPVARAFRRTSDEGEPHWLIVDGYDEAIQERDHWVEKFTAFVQEPHENPKIQLVRLHRSRTISHDIGFDSRTYAQRLTSYRYQAGEPVTSVHPTQDPELRHEFYGGTLAPLFGEAPSREWLVANGIDPAEYDAYHAERIATQVRKGKKARERDEMALDEADATGYAVFENPDTDDTI